MSERANPGQDYVSRMSPRLGRTREDSGALQSTSQTVASDDLATLCRRKPHAITRLEDRLLTGSISRRLHHLRAPSGCATNLMTAGSRPFGPRFPRPGLRIHRFESYLPGRPSQNLVDDALAAGGDTLSAGGIDDVYRHLADLLAVYSPGEVDRIAILRLIP